MRIVSFLSQKGGCGKTTLATAFAVAAWQAGHKTLIIDLDPQRSASQWWQSREADEPLLVEAESEQLSKAIEVAEQKKMDTVVIDTPPLVEPITAAAARVADFCFIPCQPTIADMRAQAPTVQVIKRLSKPAAFVLNRCQARGSRTEEARRGLAVYGLPVAPTGIVNRNVYSDAFAMGLSATEFASDPKAANELESFWTWAEKKMGKLL